MATASHRPTTADKAALDRGIPGTEAAVPEDIDV